MNSFMSPVIFETQAGTIEVYQDRDGYWVRNAEGSRIGDMGCGAFKTDVRAMSVAIAICARLRASEAV